MPPDDYFYLNIYDQYIYEDKSSAVNEIGPGEVILNDRGLQDHAQTGSL